jgi:hypothetical protein
LAVFQKVHLRAIRIQSSQVKDLISVVKNMPVCRDGCINELTHPSGKWGAGDEWDFSLHLCVKDFLRLFSTHFLKVAIELLNSLSEMTKRLWSVGSKTGSSSFATDRPSLVDECCCQTLSRRQCDCVDY